METHKLTPPFPVSAASPLLGIIPPPLAEFVPPLLNNWRPFAPNGPRPFPFSTMQISSLLPPDNFIEPQLFLRLFSPKTTMAKMAKATMSTPTTTAPPMIRPVLVASYFKEEWGLLMINEYLNLNTKIKMLKNYIEFANILAIFKLLTKYWLLFSY